MQRHSTNCPHASRLITILQCATALALISACALGQIPTAYQMVSGSEAGQMYMESMYLPSVTPGPWAPAWSPDGREIAFAMQGSIWKLPISGGTASQVTVSDGYDSEPQWSPDGKYIAFTRDTGHAMEIWIVTPDGSSPRQLTSRGGINVDPEWHSQNEVFYTSSVGGKKFGLWRVQIANASPDPVLVDEHQNIEPTSSPDGRYVALVSQREDFANPGSALPVPASYGPGPIWRLELATKSLKLLSNEETLWHTHPRWSPDGHKIVYVSLRTGHNQLFLLNAETGIPVQLTRTEAEPFTPIWSPDGTKIAYVSNSDHDFHIMIMPSVGGGANEVKIMRLQFRIPSGRLQANIIDENGRPATARIYLTASDHRAWAPRGVLEKESVVTGDHYFYATGGFVLDLPAGPVTVEAARGFETRPTTQEVQVTEGNTATVTLRLSRIANMATEGWYSGDNHLHMNYGGVYSQTPATLLQEAEGEDLNVVNSFPTNHNNHLVDLQYFRGAPDPLSKENYILYFNEEYRPNLGGHLGLLNMKQFFYPVYDGYPGTPYQADYPSNAQVFDAMHAQGAVAGYVHPYLLSRGQDPSQRDYAGAQEFPADVALGKVDYYDVMCIWSDEYPVAEVWYKLLNLGFKIPASAGTDAMPNYWRAPGIGTTRVYVHVEGQFTYENWIRGLLHGRTFVTDGPLLSFTVNGQEAGTDLKLSESSSFQVHAEATSIVPMETLDILQNGKVVYSQKTQDDPYHIVINKVFPVQHSGWVAARVTGPSKQHLVMDSFVYAHTSPIYLTVGSERARSPEDAQYFVRWMDSAIRLAKKRNQFDTEDQKLRIIDVYNRGRAEFERLAEER